MRVLDEAIQIANLRMEAEALSVEGLDALNVGITWKNNKLLVSNVIVGFLLGKIQIDLSFIPHSFVSEGKQYHIGFCASALCPGLLQVQTVTLGYRAFDVLDATTWDALVFVAAGTIPTLLSAGLGYGVEQAGYNAATKYGALSFAAPLTVTRKVALIEILGLTFAKQ